MEAQLILDYPTRLALAWTAAAFLAWAVRTVSQRSWHTSIGFGIMTVPLWLSAFGFVNSFQTLIDSGSVLPTYSTWILSGLWTRSLLVDLGYVGTGFLIYAADGRWRELFQNGTRGLAKAVRRAGVPLGHGEWRSASVALLAFPIFLAGTWLINALVYSQPALVNGDESSVWDNMTPYHAILISLAAGVGEEVVYRGVLMVALMRIMPAWAAVVLQAVFFGFAHAGYGTIAHVLVPTLFGLVAGATALRFGIWAAIVLHVLIDVVAFGSYATLNHPWFGITLATLLVANAMATLAWFAKWLWQRVDRPNAS